jgi:UDP-2,3-diacylglucosamine hydrolase
MTRAYFVSDLHLSAADDERSVIFVNWLKGLIAASGADSPSQPTHLFLVGDIFDLWIGGHEYFIHKFAPVVEALKRLSELGVEVHFFEGNHDLHLRGFWQVKLGVRVHAEATSFQLAGKTVRVEHGDMMNPDDRGYRLLRKFLRTRAMTAFALHAPSVVVAAIGDRASRLSRSYQTSEHRARPEEQIRAMVREHARRVFAESSFDLIVSGHVHVVDDFEFKSRDRRVRSVNLGSWTRKPYRVFFLSDESAGFELV